MEKQQVGETLVPTKYEIWSDGVFLKKEGLPPKPGKSRKQKPLNEEIKRRLMVGQVAPQGYATPSVARRCPSELLPDRYRVALGPVWFEAQGAVQGLSDIWVKLAWRLPYSGETTSHWVPLKTLSSQHLLTELANKGLPVSPKIWSTLTYLTECYAENAMTLPRRIISSRMGWQVLTPAKKSEPEKWLMLIGEDAIGPADMESAELLPGCPTDMVEGWTFASEYGEGEESGKTLTSVADHLSAPESTEDQSIRLWTDKFQELLQDLDSEHQSALRWLTYATFAAPLLEPAQWRGFLIHHCGDTSIGKSAAADFAMSAWGNPRKIVLDFNATPVAIPEIFKHINHLPMVFDELQAFSAKDDIRTIQPILYALILGRSKLRAKKDGGLADNRYSYKTIIKTTGEQPLITDDGRDLGGVRSRVLQFDMPVLLPHHPKPLHQWIDNGMIYGGPSRRYVREVVTILNDPNRGSVWIQNQANELQTKISAQLTRQDARYAHFAVVALAQAIALQSLFSVPFSAAKKVAITDSVAVSKSLYLDSRTSYADECLEFLRGHLISERGRYVDYDNPVECERLDRGEIKGLVGIFNAVEGETWYIPDQVDEVLRKSGRNPGKVWQSLKRLKRLCVDKRGGERLTATRLVGAKTLQVRVVR